MLYEIERFFKNYQFNWMTLTGGELFLREDIEKVFDIITEFNKDLYMLTMTTNGLLTERIVDMARKLSKKQIPFLMVTVSLDGERILHDKLRGLKGAYTKAVTSYKELRKLPGVKAQIGYTIYPESAGKFESFVNKMSEEISDFSVNDIHINTFNTSSHYYGDNTAKKVQNKYTKLATRDLRFFLKHYNAMGGVAAMAERIFQNLAIEYLESGTTPLPCKSLASSVFLDPQGFLYPCIIWNSKLGNIRDFDYDLRKIISSKKYKNLLKTIYLKKCPNCWTACEGTHSMLGNFCHPAFLRGLA